MTEPRAEQSSTVVDDCAEDKDKPLSHCDAMLLVKNGIQELLSDPILSDLDVDISVEELQDVLHLEQGKAITLYLRRFDDSILPIVVLQGATVGDLKKAIQRYVIRKHVKEGGTPFISWRYVWKTYWLVYDKQKLADDSVKLTSYGITNRDEISFLKRLRREWKEKRPRNVQPMKN
ncbi:U11/U12 small nuclear ribonucleoprotein 25 kDa protein-like [Dysidea avara]|uniref:U11/U12 small nuclear ribonucleoprotein 25 kDa protein-like n=1 Tax=Dysidea avara TaxID=196820 RepID=UPI00331B0050